MVFIPLHSINYLITNRCRAPRIPGHGVKERIASVTSFRATDPSFYDNSHLTNTRPVTDKKIMYKEWAAYHLEILQEGIQSMRRKIEHNNAVDLTEFARFADIQVEYMKRTQRQMVPIKYSEAAIKHYGLEAYMNARDIWERICTHPKFITTFVGLDVADEVAWEVARGYIGDWAVARVALKHGEGLQGHLGLVDWKVARPYLMGDELLRQGQKEVLFEWAEKTGLWALRV